MAVDSSFIFMMQTYCTVGTDKAVIELAVLDGFIYNLEDLFVVS